MTITILLLAANPKETSSLRLAEEFREIKESLNLSKNEDDFTIVQGEAIRPKDLRRLVLDAKPQIVHFSGHGSEEGIFLENNFGKSLAVSGKALASLFSLFDSVHCVVLNACYSQTQAEAIAKVTPFVVGMRKPINDRAAIQFSTGFYDGLGAHHNVESAFRFGVNAIELNSSSSSTNRSFMHDDNAEGEALEEKPVPMLLRGSVKRPLVVATEMPEPEEEKETKWSLKALLSLPFFKIGLSVTVTLVVISSLLPLLQTHQDNTNYGEPASMAKAPSTVVPTARPTATGAPARKPPPSSRERKTSNDQVKLTVSPSSLVLFLGTAPKKLHSQILTLNNKALPAVQVRWKSEDSIVASILEVSSDTKVARVSAHKKGKTKIFVQFDDLREIISVTVK